MMTKNSSDTGSVAVDIAVHKTWSPLRVVGTFFVIAFVALFLLVGRQYWLFTGGIFKTSSFNEQEWKVLNRKTDDSSCYRGGMAHDIRAKILRVGQSSNEVESILGKPDSIKGSVHEYLLGMCSGLRIDFDTLDVHFNTAGKLTSVHVVQH